MACSRLRDADRVTDGADPLRGLPSGRARPPGPQEARAGSPTAAAGGSAAAIGAETTATTGRRLRPPRGRRSTTRAATRSWCPCPTRPSAARSLALEIAAAELARLRHPDRAGPDRRRHRTASATSIDAAVDRHGARHKRTRPVPPADERQGRALHPDCLDEWAYAGRTRTNRGALRRPSGSSSTSTIGADPHSGRRTITSRRCEQRPVEITSRPDLSTRLDRHHCKAGFRQRLRSGFELRAGDDVRSADLLRVFDEAVRLVGLGQPAVGIDAGLRRGRGRVGRAVPGRRPRGRPRSGAAGPRGPGRRWRIRWAAAIRAATPSRRRRTARPVRRARSRARWRAGPPGRRPARR